MPIIIIIIQTSSIHVRVTHEECLKLFILTSWWVSWRTESRWVWCRGCGGLSCFTAAAQRDPLQNPRAGGGALITASCDGATLTANAHAPNSIVALSVVAWVCIFVETKKKITKVWNLLTAFLFSAKRRMKHLTANIIPQYQTWLNSLRSVS